MRKFQLLLAIAFLLPMMAYSQYLLNGKTADTLQINGLTTGYMDQKSIALHNNTVLFYWHSNSAQVNYPISVYQYEKVHAGIYSYDGTKLNTMEYTLPTGGHISAAAQGADGTILLAGEMDSAIILIKLDSVGNLLNSRIYLPDSLEYITSIKATPDNHFIINSYHAVTENSYSCGWWFFYYYSTYLETYLTKIDSDGNIVWHKQIGADRQDNAFYPVYTLNLHYVETEVNPDNSINVVKSAQEQYETYSRIEYLHFDQDGNLLQRKILKDSITEYSNCSFYTNAYYKAVEDGYIVITDNTDINGQRNYTRYHYDKEGNFIDSGAYNGNNSMASTIFQTIQFSNIFSSYFPTNNNVFLNLSGFGSMDISLIKLSKYYEYQWNATIPDSGFIQKSSCLLHMLDDSTMLIVNVTDNEPNDSDSIQYLRFYTVSLTADQLYYTVYIDRNRNGVYDTRDTSFYNAQVELSDGVRTADHNLDMDGHYSQFCQPGTYTSRLISYEQYLSHYSIAPEEHVTHFTAGRQTDSVFFRLTPLENIEDLQISILPVNNARPGFQSKYYVLAKNTGTKTIQQVSILFVKDTLQTYDSTATSIPTAVSNDTLIWNFDSLMMLEYREIQVVCNNAVPPLLNSGDTLHVYAQVNPVEQDAYKQDNLFYLNQRVVNSVDPNDKTEAHGAGITAQQLADREYLYYTIRFQNTGSTYATKIKIVDTLCDHLDWSSLNILSNSMGLAYKVENKSIITWWSDQVYLPDSTTNEPYSHGYVSFRIKPLGGLTPADSITNRAHIYFDYNAPITTNTVHTAILEQRITNITQKEIKSVKLYPSPTSNTLRLEYVCAKTQHLLMRIINSNGEEIYQEKLNSNTGLNNIELDVSRYANGIYFIHLDTDDHALFYGKFIKQ